jgi:hypothetical protein
MKQAPIDDPLPSILAKPIRDAEEILRSVTPVISSGIHHFMGAHQFMALTSGSEALLVAVLSGR